MRKIFGAALIIAVAASLLPAMSAAAHDATSPTAPTAPTWERLQGSDRYATSVSVAGQYAPGVPVVYIASGENFPDALSAAPAAAVQGGPLLLSHPTVLMENVRAEIIRLAPRLIVVAGGPATVSPEVYDALALLAPAIRRDSGADRYAASRAIALGAFPAGSVISAFVATGEKFPDALTSSAAAGGDRIPVFLVPGAGSEVDAATIEAMTHLGVTSVSIAGGPASVSPAIESSFATIFGADGVKRLSGSDRYVTSNEVNRSTYQTAPVAYLAKGTDYPDALSGAALAARDSAPLFIVPGNCVPADILTSLRDMGTTRLVLLGGPASLTQNVENLVECTTDLSRSGALLGFSQPFESFVPITSSFGTRVHPITRLVSMHYGTDYAKTGILGMPIRSLADGVVVAKSATSTGGAGNWISILHRDRVQSQMMHMKDPTTLAVGAQVRAGQVVGLVGTTGASTGPHLHLEIRINGTRVDPYLFLLGAPYAKPVQ
ncbi:MAG: cell wall-binding repeat-containing protein [Microbacteriaceae bacterium]|nr:cell wall-binding repeat-containing protein [Microbacteriaceae bacterium]